MWLLVAIGRTEITTKQKGRRSNYASLIKLTLPKKRGLKKPVCLELEFHTETKRRRELEDRSSAVERIRNGGNAWRTAVDQEGVVLFDSTLVVENVEPIELQAELFILTQRDRVVSAEVQVVGRRRAVPTGDRVDCRAARIANES